MKLIRISLVWVIVLCSHLALSQQITSSVNAKTISLTLDEVWEKASAYSKSVQIKKIQNEQSFELIKDAKNERLPEVSVGGNYARISNMPIYKNGFLNTPSQFEVLHATYTVETEAYFNLYNGNHNTLEIKARKVESNISGEQLKMTLSEIKLQAAAFYLDMERTIKFQELMEKDIAAQEKQLQRLNVLKTNGVILKSDVLRAELKLSRQKLTLVTLNNDLRIANEKLNFLIGLAKDQQIIPLSNYTADSLHVDALAQLHQSAESSAYLLNISKQETALKDLQYKSVKANVLPKVGLFGTYKYSYPQIFLYPYSPYIYGIGLAGIKASFSPSSFYHNSHKSKVAKLELEAQEIEHAQVNDKVTQKVDEVYLRFQEALNRVEVNKENIKQATENRRIVNNTYFNQTSLITDLLDADTQLLQTRFDLAAAEIAAQLQYFELKNITGDL